jgi:hypothetical protein
MAPRNIDYLFEDPPIQNQQFALISIVGPHMPQKCDVWGLKIRGVAENLEKAKTLSQKILRFDNNYDVYTVEMGKFFPLVVNPLEVSNVEYQNTKLNELIKSYLENREIANEQWTARKNEMIQEAIKEGKNQEEFANKPEHPVAVLLRINNYQDSIKELEERLELVKEDLSNAKEKFAGYSQEERENAESTFNEGFNERNESNEISGNSSGINESNEISGNSNESNESNENSVQVTEIVSEEIDSSKLITEKLDKIRSLETEISDLKSLQSDLPNTTDSYKRVSKTISELEETIRDLKLELNNNSSSINDYINQNYSNPQIHF